MSKPSKKEATRTRIVEAAGKEIRQYGYGGVGVDGIAKEAGVTSGALYGHFGSKDQVFKATVSEGMRDFIESLDQMQETKGDRWIEAFIDWYLSVEHRRDMRCGCALPGLSVDVGRADQDTQVAYEEQLRELSAAVAKGLPGSDTRLKKKTAWTLLSLLTGAVVMARAVDCEKLALEITKQARLSAKKTLAGLLPTKTAG